MKRFRLAIGADGSGTCFQAVLNGMLVHDTYEVAVAYTNAPGCKAMERAKLNGIPTVELEFPKHPDEPARRGHEILLEERLDKHKFDAIIMLGDEYRKTGEFVADYTRRSIPILNTHPAPAPQFRGLNGYDWALGEHKQAVKRNAWTCVTFHTIEAEIDRGIIIAQCPVPIYEGDTAENGNLKNRGLQIEHFQIVQCLDYLARGLVRFDNKTKTADVLRVSDNIPVGWPFVNISETLRDGSHDYTVQVDTSNRRWDVVLGSRQVDNPIHKYGSVPANLAFTYVYRQVRAARLAGADVNLIFDGVDIHPIIMKSDQEKGLRPY